MCRSTLVSKYQQYSQEIAIVALVIALLELQLIIFTCHTLCKRRKLYIFTPAQEIVGEPYTPDGKRYIGVFPLLYGTCVGFRQLVFFACLFLPILVALPATFSAMLPKPDVSSFIITNATVPASTRPNSRPWSASALDSPPVIVSI